MTTTTARQILTAHGLPEDVIDGVLAVHARELGALIGTAAHADPESTPPNTPRASARRGGMIAARLVLARHADTLRAAAAAGGAL